MGAMTGDSAQARKYLEPLETRRNKEQILS